MVTRVLVTKLSTVALAAARVEPFQLDQLQACTIFEYHILKDPCLCCE